MGEWKRVYLNGRRTGLLLLLAVLCAGLFILSLLEQVTPGEFGRMMSANRYTASLAEQWRGVPIEELSELERGERQRLQNIFFWYFDGDGTYPFDTEEEALKYIWDLPDLARTVQEHDNDGLFRTYEAYYHALDELQAEIRHLDGYGEYLAEIQSEAEIRSHVSIFSKPGGFSVHNLAKTAKDFKKILDVEVQFGNSRGIERWLGFV